MATSPVSKLTEEQYLKIDRAAEIRSEFIDGEMFAMSGGTNRHGRIQRGLFVELSAALEDGGCEIFGSDSRVRVSSRAYVYPDATVVCGGSQTIDGDDDILINPVAIFEVLSPSTEKYDRGLKFQLYRGIDSLKEYILVNQHQLLIERFTRRADGTWSLQDYQGPDEQLNIDAIGVTISLRRIYRWANMPPAK